MLPLRRFRDFIRTNGLFSADDLVLLAVSGGKDSVLLARLFNDCGFRFGIAHCNFSLRGAESDGDEAFVRELAKTYGVPVFTTRFDTRGYAAERRASIQVAARELRYDWFETIRNEFGYDYVAVAHHRSDSAETMLVNLVRGTGLEGLHGIRAKRDRIIRPLLFLDQAAIDGLIHENNIAYREDSSNASTDYLRNRLRHDVMPVLKTINPSIERGLADTASYLSDIGKLVADAVENARRRVWKTTAANATIDLTGLRQLHPLRLYLYELFKPYGFTGEVLGDLESCLDKQPGKSFYSESHRLTVDRGQLILTAVSGAPDDVMIHENSTVVTWNGLTINSQKSELVTEPANNPGSAQLDADRIVYPVTVRSWRQGDVFRPLGMRGTKKLSDFLVGQKVPLPAKPFIPVFVNGNGDIIWVAGYRISDDYKTGPQTKKVVIFDTHE